MLASKGGYVNVVKPLLRHKAQVNLQDKVDATEAAMMPNDYEFVIRVFCQYGQTALMLASEMGRIAVLDLLLLCNPQMDLQNKVRHRVVRVLWLLDRATFV